MKEVRWPKTLNESFLLSYSPFHPYSGHTQRPSSQGLLRGLSVSHNPSKLQKALRTPFWSATSPPGDNRQWRGSVEFWLPTPQEFTTPTRLGLSYHLSWGPHLPPPPHRVPEVEEFFWPFSSINRGGISFSCNRVLYSFSFYPSFWLPLFQIYLPCVTSE